MFWQKDKSKVLILVAVALVLVAIIAGSVWKVRCAMNTDNDSEDTMDIYELDPKMVEHDDEQNIDYVSNIIIVNLNGEFKPEYMERIKEIVDCELVGGIPELDRYELRVAKMSYDELVAVGEELKNETFIRSAYPDLAFKFVYDAIPNDPWKITDKNKENEKKNRQVFGGSYTGEFGVWNEDEPGGENWWLEAINAPSAWDYNDKLKRIKVGIIDNEFDKTHEDLKDVIKHVSKENIEGWVKSHGTHVAGIIGAKANNKKGITGTAWNADIYTYDIELSFLQNKIKSIMGQQYNYGEAFAKALKELVADNGCKVINLSIGLHEDDKPIELFSKDTAQYFADVLGGLLIKGNDFIIVESAGNGDKNGVPMDVIYDGIFCQISQLDSVIDIYDDNGVKLGTYGKEELLSRVITVGATQNEGGDSYSVSSFSNYGDNVDVWAPGTAIFSTISGKYDFLLGSMDMTSFVSGGYDYKSGTSMSAPIVSGVAALVWGANPNLSGPEVKEIICSENNQKKISVSNNEHYPKAWYGMVNAKLAVEDALGRLKDPTEVEAPSPVPKEVDSKKIWGDIEVEEYVTPGYEVHFYLPKTVKVSRMEPPKFGPGEGEYCVYLTGEGMQDEFFMSTSADTKEVNVIGDAAFNLKKFQEICNMEYF